MKNGYRLAAGICVILALILLVWYVLPEGEPTITPVPDGSVSGEQGSSGSDAPPEVSVPEVTEDRPADFEQMRQSNPDVYAWITVPGTVIDYPVVQSATDDSFYLNHDSSKRRSQAGALFTEHAYNTRSFSDPVTVLYGHRLKSGALFGELQAFYSDRARFDRYRTIQIRLPDRELTYEIFAALPYDSRHILYNYDFTQKRVYRAFFEDILSARGMSVNIDTACDLSEQPRILILSTCLRGDRSQRYLVMARQLS